MAIVKPTPKDQRSVSLNRTIKLPRNRYSLRITEEAFKMSAKNNAPMIVLSFEFVAPDTFVNPVDGSIVNIAGCKLKDKYITLQSKSDGVVDEKKSATCFNMYSDLRDLLGVPIGDDGIDIENPPKSMEGLIIDAVCDGEEFATRMDPTPEQRKRGEMGAIIKDANGRELKSYTAVVVEILGLADPSIANVGGKSSF